MRKSLLFFLTLTVILSNLSLSKVSFATSEKKEKSKEELAEEIENTYIVGYDEKSKKKIDKKVSKYGEIKYEFEAINAYGMVLNEKGLKKLISENKDIKIQKNIKMKNTNYVEGQQYKVEQQSIGQWQDENYLNSKALWDLGYKGSGISIAVIDSGVQKFHVDLDKENIETYDCRNGIFKDNNPCVEVYGLSDHNGSHGTHVTGIIAANDNNTGIVGVAPESHIVSYRADHPVDLEADGSPVIDFFSVAKALDNIYQRNKDENKTNDIDIVNISAGTYNSEEKIDGINHSFNEEMINKVYSTGAMIVSGSGNDHDPNKTEDDLLYPASFENVISVGAMDSLYDIAPFSNQNSQVDFVAPGVTILSTVTDPQPETSTHTPEYDLYGIMSGTSMASPMVAGLLALYKQQFPNYSPAQLKQLLEKNAEDLGDIGRDNVFGHGLVKAVKYAHETPYEYNFYSGGIDITKGLIDTISGRIDYADNLDHHYLFFNDAGNRNFNANEKVRYHFEQLVSIDKIHATTDSSLSNINVSFYDSNETKIGSTIPLTSINTTNRVDTLSTPVEDVQYVEFVNSDSSVKMGNVEFFGRYNKSAFEPEKIDIDIGMGRKDIQTFYDDPRGLQNPVQVSGLAWTTAKASEGYYYSWGNGYNWYKVSIPDKGIYDKWVKTPNDIIYQGKNNKVGGRVIESNEFLVYMFEDNRQNMFPSSSYVVWEFNSPVDISHMHIKRNTLDLDEEFRLKVELFDSNGVKVETKIVTNEDYFKRYFRLSSVGTKYHDIKKVKITNEGTKGKYVQDVDFF